MKPLFYGTLYSMVRPLVVRSRQITNYLTGQSRQGSNYLTGLSRQGSNYLTGLSRQIAFPFFILTENFIFVSFFACCISYFFLFGVNLRFLGPYRSIFGAWVESVKFFGVYSLRLITFILLDFRFLTILFNAFLGPF